jgi:uncharacterized protein
MGPLIPQGVIGAEWEFLIAFFIGIAFGFVLEQAGFSSSRKLAGVFYGYDFVVMRVFFTAAVTAMIGLLFFGWFGWIDLSQIFVLPTFLWSAIVGGVIMGLGFIIGGFCPGTSVCGAAIGKIDAMVFIGGIILGIFFFGETYSLFEKLNNGWAFGDVKVYDALGLPREVFALFLILMALGMFWMAGKIEKKVKKVDY